MLESLRFLNFLGELVVTPAPETNSTPGLPAEKMALLRDLVRDLLKASPNGGAKEVAIRDEQGNVLAHLVPGALQCLVEVNLEDGDSSGQAEEEDIAVEDLLANWGKV